MSPLKQFIPGGAGGTSSFLLNFYDTHADAIGTPTDTEFFARSLSGA